MCNRLVITRLLILSLVVVLAQMSIAVAAEYDYTQDARIRKVEGAIRELEYALEHQPDSERVEQWKSALAEHKQEREQLINASDNVLRQKAREDREAEIHKVQGAIKELEYALEHHADSEKVEQWKKALAENTQKLKRLMATTQDGKRKRGEFAELEMAIDRTRGQLRELEQGIGQLQEEGGNPEKLEVLHKRFAEQEAALEKYQVLLEKRRADARLEEATAAIRLGIFSLKYADADNLADVIAKFLTHSGVIAADVDTNSLVIRDAATGLDAARQIIKALDKPGRFDEEDEEGEGDNWRESAFIGEVLEVSPTAITIARETEEGVQETTLHVPVRRREDGTSIPFEELSVAVTSQEIGSIIKVYWRRGEDELWIRRITDVDEESLEEPRMRERERGRGDY